MMKRNIAVAMGLALASGFANAQTQGTNTVEVDMTLEAYVAAGLLANVTSSLQFPDIVKPLTGSHKVTVGCDGGITYDNNLATPDGNAEDATGNNANELGQNLAGSIGTISISGEDDYALNITGDVAGEPGGMTITAAFNVDGSGAADTGSLDWQLSDDGTPIVVQVCGSLVVSSAIADGDVSTKHEPTMTVTINYR